MKRKGGIGVMMKKRTVRQKMQRDFQRGLYNAKRHRIHYLFMLPYTVLFLLFTVLPVVLSILLSFTYFNGLEMPIWTGLANYYKLFLNDDIFITALKNTLVFAVVIGPGGYILSFCMAWLLNELPRIQRVLLTILFYAPSISGAMYMIWQYIFSGDSQGLANSLLLQLGMIDSPIQFFKNSAYVVPICMLVMLWMSLGTSFLALIAGLQGVDRQLYEAGSIDGIRNRWQELWFITLPVMKEHLMFSAIMSITSAFSVGPVISALAGFPTVDYAAHTIMIHLTDYGSTRFEMGYASAIATLLFLLMIGSNKLVQKFLSKVGT